VLSDDSKSDGQLALTPVECPMLELSAAFVGGLCALGLYILSQHLERRRMRRTLVDALVAELDANREMLSRSTDTITSALAAQKEKGYLDAETEVRDESTLFITELMDLPIQTWINQDARSLLQGLLLSDLVRYKVCLNRVNYLVGRNKNFKYRVHYLITLAHAQGEANEALIRLTQRLTSQPDLRRLLR
jgi:hypothetical protein